MKKYFLAFTIVALISTSCAVVKTATIKTMDINGAGVIQKPVVADLDVKDVKVTGTSISQSGQLLDNVKELAVADALKKANADILVELRYETETSQGKTTVTATGYPASYINFRSIKEEDVKLIKAKVIRVAMATQPVQQPKQQKKHSSGGITVGVLGIITSVVLLLSL